MRVLEQRVAVVTGAGSGIGRAIACRLAREGCHIALVDMDANGLESTGKEIETYGVKCSQHLVDVSDSQAVGELAQAVAQGHGEINILINNAGVNIHGPFSEHSIDDIDWILGVNLRGVLYGCHAFYPFLKQAKEAHVVNIASLAGMVAFPMQSTYSASKFGVRGFSASLRMEWASQGIGVTTVLPGAVRTPLLNHGRTYNPSMSNRMAELMQRHGRPPEKIAAAVVRSIRRNRPELVLGPDAQLSRWAQWLSPGTLRWGLSRAFRLNQRQIERDTP